MIELDQALLFLNDYYSTSEITAAEVGTGAWSRCFGFTYDDKALVAKFGKHVDDFLTDQRAYRFNGPGLPVPQVYDIGEAYDGYYAIADRKFGVPLESVGKAEWEALIPSLVDMLEALRTADIEDIKGYGGWLKDGTPSHTSWTDFMLAITREKEHERTQGWRQKLAKSEIGQAAFEWGTAKLIAEIVPKVPRSITHRDLINRNALVKDGKVSGVFDWGCCVFGDHLYDLAWFEFWGSWYPELDMGLLRQGLETRWAKIGYRPDQLEQRLAACYLHIGLDHLAYNAAIEDEVNLELSAKRMHELA